MSDLKKEIVFFGSYLVVLKNLVDKLRVALVVVERGKVDPELISFCRENQLCILEINSLDELPGEQDFLSCIGVVASFGLIFKQRHLDRFAALYNFHPGCVYSNRGRHPLPSAILRGNSTMAISLHRIIDEKIDCGGLLLRVELPISYADSYGSNYSRLLSALPYMTSYLVNCLSVGDVPELNLIEQENSYFPPLPRDVLKSIIEADDLMSWKP